MLKQVFLSYRLESPEHARAVRQLGQILRDAKIPVALDQFYLDEHPGGPDEGWPKWCEDTADRSACVIIVASKGWFNEYEAPSATNGGCGAALEARILRQHIYDHKGVNERIRLALFNTSPTEIPTGLKSWHHYRPLDKPSELEGLVRWIAFRLNIDVVPPPSIQWPEAVHFDPDCADRDAEWPLIQGMLTGHSQYRILFVEGNAGVGKTEVLKQTVRFAEKLGIPTMHFNCKFGTANVSAILGQIHLDLEHLLPNFSNDGASRSHILRKDIRLLRKPILFIFDHFEDCGGNHEVANWLIQQILPEVETSPGLMIIISGQTVPKIFSDNRDHLTKRLTLSCIDKLEHWEPWVHRTFPKFRSSGAHLPTIVMAAKGKPSEVISLCKAIDESQ